MSGLRALLPGSVSPGGILGHYMYLSSSVWALVELFSLEITSFCLPATIEQFCLIV